MASKASNTTIGAFVLAAIALAAVGIVLLGQGTWFRNSFMLAFEFEGDVSGLAVGAPVTIKGFKLGTVRELRLDYDLKTGSFRTTALAEITPSIVPTGDKARIAALQDSETMSLERERILLEMVAGGARAQLNLQSFVTGLLRIDIAFPSNLQPAELGLTSEGYWNFPTQTSSLEALQQTLTSLPLREMVNESIETLKSIRGLADSADLQRGIAGIDELIANLQTTVTNLDQSVSALRSDFSSLASSAQELLQTTSGAVTRLEAETSVTLADTRQLLVNIDAEVKPTAARILELSATAEATLAEAGKLLGSLNGVTPSDSALAHQLSTALGSLTRALDSVRVLANYLEQHPEALLRGKD